MFKRKFKNDFDFFEKNSFQIENENDYKDFDRSIYVVYEKSEMIDYLKSEKKGSNVLVCLFNKQLYSSLSFMDEINNLLLLDESKTKQEIVKDLKMHLKKVVGNNETINQYDLSGSNMFQMQFHNLYKALFFLL